jgi:hypothetical protein
MSWVNRAPSICQFKSRLTELELHGKYYSIEKGTQTHTRAHKVRMAARVRPGKWHGRPTNRLSSLMRLR